LNLFIRNNQLKQDMWEVWPRIPWFPIVLGGLMLFTWFAVLVVCFAFVCVFTVLFGGNAYNLLAIWLDSIVFVDFVMNGKWKSAEALDKEFNVSAENFNAFTLWLQENLFHPLVKTLKSVLQVPKFIVTKLFECIGFVVRNSIRLLSNVNQLFRITKTITFISEKLQDWWHAMMYSQLFAVIPRTLQFCARILAFIFKTIVFLLMTIVAPWRSIEMISNDQSLSDSVELAALDYLALLCVLLIVVTLYKLPALNRALKTRPKEQSYSEAIRGVIQTEFESIGQSSSEVCFIIIILFKKQINQIIIIFVSFCIYIATIKSLESCC